MAKSSFVKAEREELIRALEAKFGLQMARSASATAGLSVANKDMKTNGLAHLLCSSKNFPFIRWLLADGQLPEIPEEFKNHFGEVSVLYAAGSAMRICYQHTKDGVQYCQRHPSKDAALMGDEFGMRFCLWAQSWRVETLGGFAGTSASLKELEVREIPDDFGNAFGKTQFGKMLSAQQLQVRNLAQTGLKVIMQRPIPQVTEASVEEAGDFE